MSALVYGSPPQIVGRVLEDARLQGFVLRGVPVAGAAVVYLKITGAWHRLAIDHGTVHWHSQEAEPQTWCMPEEDWEYPVRDLPGASQVLGVRIASVVTSVSGDDASVEFLFENGRKLVYAGEGDENVVSAV